MPPPRVVSEPSAPVSARESPDEPSWPIWTAPAAVGLGLVLGFFAILVVEVLARLAGGGANPSPAVNVIGNVLFDLGFVAAALYLAVRFGRARPEDFGFRRLQLRLAAGAVVLAGVGYYVLSALYASLLHLPNEKLPKELGVTKGPAALVAAAVFVCVIAPVAEELFFRGFLFGALRRWRIVVGGRNVGIWVAALLTAILFGLAHAGSAPLRYLIPLGLLGFVLCLVRWRTRSLYPCIALHSINNSLSLGVSQHWNVGELLGLTAASLLVVAACTGPLSGRRVALRA